MTSAFAAWTISRGRCCGAYCACCFVESPFIAFSNSRSGTERSDAAAGVVAALGRLPKAATFLVFRFRMEHTTSCEALALIRLKSPLAKTTNCHRVLLVLVRTSSLDHLYFPNHPWSCASSHATKGPGLLPFIAYSTYKNTLLAILGMIVTTPTPVRTSASSRNGTSSHSIGRLPRPDTREVPMPVATTATRWLRHMERSTRANDWTGRADSEGRRAWWDDIR
jgi:hypothetical protein